MNFSNGICQMLKKTKLHERRQYARYRVRDGAVAVPRSSFANIGRIIDISSNGLAVRYIGKLNWLKEASQIDIMMIDDDYYISKLLAKIISDSEYTFYASGKMV